MSTVLFPGSPGAHGPPALFNRHPSQGTWVNYKRRDFQRRLSWGIFPQRGRASFGRESNGEITGGGWRGAASSCPPSSCVSLV